MFQCVYSLSSYVTVLSLCVSQGMLMSLCVCERGCVVDAIGMVHYVRSTNVFWTRAEF